MITLEVKGQANFMAAIDAAIVGIPLWVGDQFHKWTLLVLKDLLLNTPQWSGDTAANWNYSVGSPDLRYIPIVRKALSWGAKAGDRLDPLERGDLAAVFAAYGRAEDGPAPRYDQTVYLTNNTPIAASLENMTVSVRPVNLVNGAVAMAEYTAMKWRNIPFRTY